jgi:hypothetical protein
MTHTTDFARAPGEPSGFDERREPEPQPQPPAPRNGTGNALTVYDDYLEDSGRGLENRDAGERLTPFMAIMHQSSPQMDREDPLYIRGAKEGDLFLTTTGELFDGEEGIDWVSFARSGKLYGEWVPRDAGGGGGKGFRGVHKADDRIVVEARKAARDRGERDEFAPIRVAANGTVLIEQYNLFGFFAARGTMSAETARPAVVGVTSTRIKAYRLHLERADAIRYPTTKGLVRPALWSHVWSLRTIRMSNDSGRWAVYNFDLRGGPNPVDSLILPTDPLFAMGREFYRAFTEGRVEADYDSADTGSRASGGGAADPEAPPF